MPKKSPISERKVSVFIDGTPVIHLQSEYTYSNLTRLLTIAYEQLEKERQPTLHLPAHIPVRVARQILTWTEEAFSMPNHNRLAMPELSNDLFKNMDLYLGLISVGIRPHALLVPFHVAKTICDHFSNEWRTWDETQMDDLEDYFGLALAFEGWTVRTLLFDPVFRMVAHTVAYGLQNNAFANTLQLQRYVRHYCPSLWDAVQAIGIVRYVIRSLVADPNILPLPARRRAARRRANPSNPTPRDGEEGILFPDLDDLEMDDQLPFSDSDVPSPSWFPSSPSESASPVSITVSRLLDMGLDGVVMAVGASAELGGGEGDGWEEEDVEMQDGDGGLATPMPTPSAHM